MTTKTKKTAPKQATPAQAMEALEQLEAEAAEADADARDRSQRLTRAQGEHDALNSQRFRLLNRQPELADHNGNPVDPDNQLALLEQRRAEIGDLADLTRQYDHARKIEQVRNERVREFVAANHELLAAAQRPRAEAAADQLTEALKTARAAADHYLGTKNRSEGLTAPVPGLTTRDVPGDEVHDLIRLLDGIGELPPPVHDATPKPQAVIVFPDDRPWGQAAGNA